MVRYILVGAVMLSVSIVTLSTGKNAGATPAVNQVRLASAREQTPESVGVTDCTLAITVCHNVTK